MGLSILSFNALISVINIQMFFNALLCMQIWYTWTKSSHSNQNNYAFTAKVESRPLTSFRYQKRKFKIKSYHLRQRINNRRLKPCIRQVAAIKNKVEFQHASPDEEAKLKLSAFETMKHKLLHHEWIMFNMQFGIDLNDFVQSIDPLQSIKVIKELNSNEFLKSAGMLKPMSMISLQSNVAMFNHERSPTADPIEFNNLSFNKYQDLSSVSSQFTPTYLQSLQMNKMNDLPIVIDTGASTSITPVLGDFVGDLKPTDIAEVKQLSGNTKVVGKGIVEWEVRDLWNVSKIIRTEAYYIPDATIRLFSPQAYFQRIGGGSCLVEGHKIKILFPEGESLEFPYNRGGNLPLMLTSSQLSNNVAGARIADGHVLSNTSILNTLMSVVEQTNQNLTASQKELLLLHQKLGHINLQWIQRLCGKNRETKTSVLLTKNPNVSTVERPLCAACQMAKQPVCTPISSSKSNSTVQMKLKRAHLNPGDAVSMDQYISRTPGRLPHTKGKEQKKFKYSGGTIFADHASSFVFVNHQVSLTAGSTLVSKKKFEQQCAEYGVQVQEYHTDNVPFGSKAFMENIELNNQKIKFSGVGAHHQNGVAERAIKTITQLARAMLLHATIMWPDQANLELWPFAMDHAVYIYNNVPRIDNNKSSVELFSSTLLKDYAHLNRLHVFGCPAYVLDPTLQDGHKIPKWRPRTRRGQFLGYSQQHSSTVGRILNIRTGNVSPQYHVVYDDKFSSVPNAESGGMFADQPFDAKQWSTLIKEGNERVVPEPSEPVKDKLPELHHDWIFDDLSHRHNTDQVHQNPATTSEESENITDPLFESEGADDNVITDPLFESEGADDATLPPQPQSPDANDIEINNRDDNPSTSIEPRRRSGRRKQKPTRLIETMNPHQKSYHYLNRSRKCKLSCIQDGFLMAMKWEYLTDFLHSNDFKLYISNMQQNTDLDQNTVEWLHPMMLMIQANAQDNPNWDEAMNGPNQEGYWEACLKEISTLQDSMQSWEVVMREPWMNVLPSTWAFKCKRYPSGEVRKLKARFCARGDKQIEGVDYFDTFAPVVNWTTVRIMLIMSIILNLSTKQVDYTAAFVHAPIDLPPHYEQMSKREQEKAGVYIEMPRGFMKPGKVLKLKKSLYGLKQAPRNFFMHLKAKLESIGFVSDPDIDPCLFVSDKVICLVYVDDTLFFSPDEIFINEVIDKLSKTDLELEVEESVAGFLGVHIDRSESGQIKLTQEGLTKRIIEALNITDLPRKFTPATSEPLTKDEHGDPPNSTYNYKSIIGMLQYLQGHSRPDLTYAVSQCARFSHSPKRSHEVALERIGQYLKGTVDKGLILSPTALEDVDVFVDADFAGLWPYEDKCDPVSVKSRTGYVITVASCPVIWTSKLQIGIALSTMEAEYNALSLCMKTVLPFHRTLKRVIKSLKQNDSDSEITFKVSIWEDNIGALTLANLEPGRHTPRSKHYGIKMHWFRSHLKPNSIIVRKIESKFQKADIFTKGLPKVTYESIRKQLCGW